MIAVRKGRFAGPDLPPLAASPELARCEPSDCSNWTLLQPEQLLPILTADVAPVREEESCPLSASNGRVTARDAATLMPLPPFDHSAVDGYGIPAAELRGGELPVVARYAAGPCEFGGMVPAGAVRLLTGASIPPGIGAVVAEERVRSTGDRVWLSSPVLAGANIRRRGEDVAAGQTIVEAGRLIDARHIAVLAAAGIDEVRVRRKVKVALLSTGDELRAPGELLQPGTIYDSNRPMLQALLAKPWIDVLNLGLQRDDPDRLAELFRAAAKSADLIISSGGVSGSDADHVLPAVLAAGGAGQTYRLALKPGKPLAFGCLGRALILGLPGNPLAALVNVLLFGLPILRRLAGAPGRPLAGQPAMASVPIRHKAGRREFLPAEIVGNRSDDVLEIATLGRGGSARLRPLVLADGFAEIHHERGDLSPGDRLTFHSFAAAFTL